jgi:hypothetical protein
LALAPLSPNILQLIVLLFDHSLLMKQPSLPLARERAQVATINYFCSCWLMMQCSASVRVWVNERTCVCVRVYCMTNCVYVDDVSSVWANRSCMTSDLMSVDIFCVIIIM